MTRRNYKQISSYLHDNSGANIIDNTTESLIDSNNPRRPAPKPEEVNKRNTGVVPGQGGGPR